MNNIFYPPAGVPTIDKNPATQVQPQFSKGGDNKIVLVHNLLQNGPAKIPTKDRAHS